MFNKKAQVGETMTWLVGTIIIVVMLGISIYIVSATSFINIKSFDLNKKTDLLVTKSFMGYLLSEDNSGVTIWKQVKDEKGFIPDIKRGGFEESNVKLAKEIFPVLYKDEYPLFWMGVVEEEYSHPYTGVQNEYFKFRFEIPSGCTKKFYDKIKLNSGSILELLLGCKK